ncbi:MAG: aminopeptidase P family protein [Clostridia bacterium]|nr:aminopeptidase P family protein [Clostridia bacterium]
MKFKALKKQMEILNMDSFYVSNLSNVYYLSGFKGTAGTIFVTKEKVYLITDFRYISQAKEQTENIEIIDVAKGEKEIFCDIIKKHNISSVGFEQEYISYKRFTQLGEIFSGVKLLASEGMVEKLRIIKTKEEIAAIEKACEIADEAFERVYPLMKEGISELEVAAMLEYEMKKQGATGVSFETIVASGVRSSMPHGTASEKLLYEGDFVVMDFGCIYKGYCSDITRTVAIGNASDKMRDIYNKVLTVQEESLKEIKKGAFCKEVDNKSRQMFSLWGIDSYFGHSLGHGVGIDIHELPNLSSKSSFTIQENMIVTVEPGIYIENEFGVRIEDTVAVTENGAKRLTKSGKHLIIC